MIYLLKTVLAGVGVLLCNSLYASGIEFTSGSWKEIITKARQENKLIFVDFHAEWCAPCRWMARETFTQDGVGEFYNQNFINVSIDAEKEFRDLVAATDIKAFPTLAIFDTDGNLISKKEGAQDAKGILSFGRKAVEIGGFEEAYLADPKNAKVIFEYASVLKHKDEKKAKNLVRDYLISLDKSQWIEPNNWNLVKEFSQAGDEIFNHVRSQRSAYYQAIGNDLSTYFFDNVKYLVDKSVRHINPSMLDESVELEMEARALNNSLEYDKKYYKLNIYYKYYLQLGMHDRFVETYRELVTKYFWDNEEKLRSSTMFLNSYIAGNTIDKKFYQTVLTWSDRTVALNKNGWRGYYSKAVIYYSMNNKTKAMQLAKKALANAPEDMQHRIQSLIVSIEYPE